MITGILERHRGVGFDRSSSMAVMAKRDGKVRVAVMAKFVEKPPII
jgi:hypothetical protein